ncbi:MAG: hydroxyacid dehydrogenase, partial [Chloroflexota bacterium]|nr:hydroxyacid dehydrogenase [Chloroflexota bacterium]
MADYKVLVTGHTFRRVSGDHVQRLTAAGCALINGPYPRAATEAELLPLVGEVDAVLASTDAFTRRVLEAAPRLKIISRVGVGYDAIDIEAATEHGVWVTITPGTNEHSVADLTLALVLALARQIVPMAEQTRAGKWERAIGMELAGATLGLIGFGRIGREVALRARAFGTRVIIYDVIRDEEAAASCGAAYVTLEALLAQADFVSLH